MTTGKTGNVTNMASTVCTVCGAGFARRRDAVYCSSACRQKAHRARTAGRLDALQQRLAKGSGPKPLRREDARSLQFAVADSLRVARERVERSRELCRLAEDLLRQCRTDRQRLDRQHWAAPGTAEKAPL